MNPDFIQAFPSHIQEKLLDLSLRKRGIDQIRSFLKLYISRHGINGPLSNLPFHPQYPFITDIRFNGCIYTLPREAYLLLWYLVEVYSIGMTFAKFKISQYAYSLATRSIREKKNIILSKWLRLFGTIRWWSQRMREADVENCRFVFVVFKCSREITFEEDGIRIQKRYHCDVRPGYHNGFNSLVDDGDWINEKRRTELFMCRANGIDPSTVPKDLFSPRSSKEWHDTESYPQDFVQEIQACLADFDSQYSWDKNNPDHPIYRVDGVRYPKINKYVMDTSSSSSSGSSESDESDFSTDPD